MPPCTRCCPTSTCPTTRSEPFRIVALLHIFYAGDDRRDARPRRHAARRTYDLVITTPDADRGRWRSARSYRGGPRRPCRVEVRVLPSNDGRDQSAFLIGCRDVLLDDGYDLVVKLHSKKTPQDGFNVGRHFKPQQFTNLLNSPGYTANLLGAVPEGARTRPGLPADDPHRLSDDGTWLVVEQAGLREVLRDARESRSRSTRSRRSHPTARCTSPARSRCGSSSQHDWSVRDFGGAGGVPGRRARAHPRAHAVLRRRRTRATTRARCRRPSTCRSATPRWSSTLDQMSATIPGDSVEQIMFLKQRRIRRRGAPARLRADVLRPSSPHRTAVQVEWMIDPSSRFGRAVGTVSHLRR